MMGAGPAQSPSQSRAPKPAQEERRGMLTRPIPRTGEQLPVIGLGTWQTFNVGTDPKERAPLREVLKRFLELGGRVIDSSPMYGSSQGVVGDALAGHVDRHVEQHDDVGQEVVGGPAVEALDAGRVQAAAPDGVALLLVRIEARRLRFERELESQQIGELRHECET